MATEAQNIQTALNNIAVQIANWVTLQPSYSLDGKSVQWDEHYKTLLEVQKNLRIQLQQAQGPYTLTSVAR